MDIGFITHLIKVSLYTYKDLILLLMYQIYTKTTGK